MMIDLDEIIEAIESSNNSTQNFLNTRTGEILYRDEDTMSDRELDDVDDLLDKDWEDIIEIPSHYDVNEYGMMQDFAWDLPPGIARDTLKASLKGSGAFRRFKDVLYNQGLQNDWYEYRDRQYMEFVKNWARENKLDFKDVTPVVYRHATQDDLDTLIELKKKELGVNDNSLDFELERFFRNQLRTGSLYEIIAWDEDKPAASGAIQWFFSAPTPEDPRGKTAFFTNFYTGEGYKDFGYEEQIAQRLFAEAGRRGTPVIYSGAAVPAPKEKKEEKETLFAYKD